MMANQTTANALTLTTPSQPQGQNDRMFNTVLFPRLSMTDNFPPLAAMEQGIPVIAVRENKNRMKNELKKLPFAPGKLFVAENYPEAVGIMTAIKAGVALSSVRRPLEETKVSEEQVKKTSVLKSL